QVSAGNMRSTRSAARYVNGDARSKKKVALSRVGASSIAAWRALRRSSSLMTFPIGPPAHDSSWSWVRFPLIELQRRGRAKHAPEDSGFSARRTPVRHLAISWRNHPRNVSDE